MKIRDKEYMAEKQRESRDRAAKAGLVFVQVRVPAEFADGIKRMAAKLRKQHEAAS